MAECGTIGHGGTIPWDLPGDRRHFAEMTAGGIVIMGHRTWESLPPGGLPGRDVVVLSRRGPVAPGVRTESSLSAALYNGIFRGPDVWIAGGADVYRQALALGTVDEIILTRVLTTCPGDTRFPDWRRFNWYGTRKTGWHWTRSRWRMDWGPVKCRLEHWRPDNAS